MVARKDGAPGSVAVACECGMEERAGLVMERARIPKRYERCDFESFVPDLADGLNYTPEHCSVLKNAKMMVQAFVANYPGGDQSGLLLMGNSGVGKTHLAVAALRELVARGHSGYFCEYGALLREIQSSYRPESEASEMRILQPVLSAEVLVIDDLGCIKPSDWVRDTVGYILNTRYAEASQGGSSPRCIIITTNYFDNPVEAPVRGPDGRQYNKVQDDPLWMRIGERMRSRLFEMCRTVEVRAPDFRRQRRQADRARA